MQIQASGLSAGTAISISVGTGGGDAGCIANAQGGCQSAGGGSSSVSATNLAASAGGGGGAVEAFEIYAGACSYTKSSVPGTGGTNTYSGSAVTSVVANDVGQTAPWTTASACTDSPGGNGGNSGGNLGAGGSGGVLSANAGNGGSYGGGGGGASADDGTGIAGYPGAGGSGEVVISWN